MNVKVLRFIVGLFFIILGILGVMTNVEEPFFSLYPRGSRQEILEIIFGVIEIVCGVIMIAGVFSFSARAQIHKAVLLVFIFWIARMVLANFVFIQPPIANLTKLLIWSLGVVAEAVIASAVFLLLKAHE